jgi:uncharacterized protein YbjT (DUF2867 family)
VDVITQAGLGAALEGVEVIIDAAGGSSPDQAEATEFFRTSASNLHKAGHLAGVEALVVISILGIDRFTAGYNAAKREHEKALLEGPIPVRILRASQFHELVERMVDWGRQGDVAHIPRMRTQPIAATTVAEALAALAIQPETTHLKTHDPEIHEIAGPKEENLAALATLLVARTGDPVRIEEVTNPEEPDAELYESGALLPGPNTRLAGPTFSEWLETPRGLLLGTAEPAPGPVR